MTAQYLKRLLKYDEPLPKNATIPQKSSQKAPKILFHCRVPKKGNHLNKLPGPKLLGRE